MIKLQQALLLLGATLFLWSCGSKAIEQRQFGFEIETNNPHRGACAIGDSICWFAGADASVLLVNSSGVVRHLGPPKKTYKQLEFRDVAAFSDSEAVVMAIGSPAIFLYTNSQGKYWDTAFYDTTSTCFFDALDFYGTTGFSFSDAQDSLLPIVVSKNSGKTWEYLPKENWPKVAQNQGGFAASGSVIKALGESSFIIALGGPKANLLYTNDLGQNWQEISTPIQAGKSSQGIFSVDVLKDSAILIAGGDYLADSTSGISLALSNDFGKTWQVLDSLKYYSSVQWVNESRFLTASRFEESSAIQHENLKQVHMPKCYVSLTIETSKMLWGSGKNKILCKPL